MNYNLGDIVTMKKVHPCGSYDFEIIRLGADVKIRCVRCSRVIMIPRVELNKKIKKVVYNEKEKD
jgi:hypothetical protein